MKYITASKLKKWREENKDPTCPIFKCKLKDTVVDHDHKTGLIRGCLDRYNLPHPVGVTQLCKRFGRFKREEQEFALKVLGVKKSEINACTNTRERIKLYRKFLTKNKYE